MTELCLRLIGDGKPVGYEYHVVGVIFHYYEMPPPKGITKAITIDNNSYIKHDSFDLGIKVEDKWWFAGDIGREISKSRPKFQLRHTGFHFELVYIIPEYGHAIVRRLDSANMLEGCNCIGNIYEQDKR